MVLFTIGHSNHSGETFIELLKRFGIETLVDVRSAPASRYNPQFNKPVLEQDLPANGIVYVFAGRYLGGRPSDPTCYKHRALPPEGTDYLHEVDYPEVMKREWFVKGVERLMEIADESLTAIMCSEENPAQCHRHHMIAKYLMQTHSEVKVKHIRGDGTVYGAASIKTSVEYEGGKQASLFD